MTWTAAPSAPSGLTPIIPMISTGMGGMLYLDRCPFKRGRRRTGPDPARVRRSAPVGWPPAPVGYSREAAPPLARREEARRVESEDAWFLNVDVPPSCSIRHRPVARVLRGLRPTVP